MTAATRSLSRSPAAAPARGRAAAPKPRAAPHTATRAKSDGLHIKLIAAAAVIAAIVGIAVIWEFGAARNLPMPQGGAIGAGGSGGAGGRGSEPTVVYRDMHDGRIMVMEVGPDGTRIKGTIAKSSLPMASDLSGDAGVMRRSSEPSTSDRVNALGSAFR